MAFKWKRTGSGRTRLSRSFFLLFYSVLSSFSNTRFVFQNRFQKRRKERSFFSAFSNNSNHSFRIEELMFLNPSYASIVQRQRIESQEKGKYREGKTPCTPCMVFNLSSAKLFSFFIGVRSVGRSNSNHQKTLLRFDPRGKSLNSSLFPSGSSSALVIFGNGASR